MKKTVEIGLFFFFIHILISSDWNIVQKHILGCKFCKCGEGEGRLGDIFPLTFPPPRLCIDCVVREDPPLVWLAYPSPPLSCPTHAIHAHSVRHQGSDVRRREEWDPAWPGSYKGRPFLIICFWSEKFTQFKQANSVTYPMFYINKTRCRVQYYECKWCPIWLAVWLFRQFHHVYTIPEGWGVGWSDFEEKKLCQIIVGP